MNTVRGDNCIKREVMEEWHEELLLRLSSLLFLQFLVSPTAQVTDTKASTMDVSGKPVTRILTWFTRAMLLTRCDTLRTAMEEKKHEVWRTSVGGWHTFSARMECPLLVLHPTRSPQESPRCGCFSRPVNMGFTWLLANRHVTTEKTGGCASIRSLMDDKQSCN